MKTTYNDLANSLIKIISSEAFKGSGKIRYVVGLAGGPGSGKSYTSNEVCRLINKHFDTEIAIVIPMGGFHLYKRELDNQPNSEELYKRRGAPYTFNPGAFLSLVKRLSVEDVIAAPSFDHRVGDPVENDIHVLPQHKVVIVEGNYLLLDEQPWCELNKEFDESWFIEVSMDLIFTRLVKRHIETGLSREQAIYRINTNDLPNAKLIEQFKNKASRIVDVLS